MRADIYCDTSLAGCVRVTCLNSSRKQSLNIIFQPYMDMKYKCDDVGITQCHTCCKQCDLLMHVIVYLERCRTSQKLSFIEWHQVFIHFKTFTKWRYTWLKKSSFESFQGKDLLPKIFSLQSKFKNIQHRAQI